MPTNNSWNSQNPAQVAMGGTGIATTTAYAPICGGTTATGVWQAASTGLSSSGYVLTSNGASALPSFQAPAALSLLFFARQTTETTNVTGDGTVYTIIYDTADVNVGTCYDTSTGVFTAPATAAYLFQSGITVENLAVANTTMNWLLNNITTTKQSTYYYNSSGTWTAGQTIGMNAAAYMLPATITSGNTLKNTIAVSGSTKTVGLYSDSATNYVWWACYKVN